MKMCYRFPVVKGKQAGRPYYIAMVPLNMLSKLFLQDEEYVLPEYRAQRKLNELRIPEIKKYILNNKDSYVFSALTASIDGKFDIIAGDIEGRGILEVALNAKFLINDGQHRKAAILAALEEDPSIEDETISVVFFEDKGLNRSQQMFTDLNKHAVKTSNSISELYDSRDALAVATRTMVSKVPFLDEYVDKEKDILGKFSSSLFTLNTFYTANKRILGKKTADRDYTDFIVCYWNSVASHMIPWRDLKNKELSKMELREKYIASQAVVIQALGKVGSVFFDFPRNKMEDSLRKLEEVNWKRNWEGWRLRVIRNNGRMINNENAIGLTANVIKLTLGMTLSQDEIKLEKEFKGEEYV